MKALIPVVLLLLPTITIAQWKIKNDDGPFSKFNRIYVVETTSNNFPYKPILLSDKEGFIKPLYPLKDSSELVYRFSITNFNGIIAESISDITIEIAIMSSGEWIKLEHEKDFWRYDINTSTDNTDWFEFLVSMKTIELMKEGQKITLRLYDRVYENTTTFLWTLSGSTKALNYLLKE